MSARRPLAFVFHRETAPRLPRDSLILPLRPSLGLPEARLLARRPEAYLSSDRADSIERDVQEIVAEWWTDPAARRALSWRGANLAECFSHRLRMALRDLLKSFWILHEVLKASSPTALWTDAPSRPSIAPYPYFAALGALLEERSQELRIPYHNLSPGAGRPRDRADVLRRLYGRWSALRASRRLRRDRPLVAVGPHPEFYRPVAETWRSRGTTIVVSPTRVLTRAAPALALFALPVEGLLTRTDRAEARGFRTDAMRTIQDVALHGPLRQDGQDLAPFLRNHLSRAFAVRLETLACLGTGFDRGLERARHVLLMDTHDPVSKAALRYARLQGVPVTVLQHGVIAGPSIYRETEGDRVAAWGPLDSRWFRENLPGEVAAEPVGCPRYDALVEDGEVSPSWLPAEPPQVLFASQPFVPVHARSSPWDLHGLLRMVLAAARRTRTWTLGIKWHPSQRPWPLPRADVPADPPILQYHREDTWALVRTSRAVLTYSSSVALEAMYLDRPVVFVGAPEPESPFHPPEDGAGLRVEDARELTDAVDRLVREEGFRKMVLEGQRAYLSQNYAPLDGRSADRLVGFVEAAST